MPGRSKSKLEEKLGIQSESYWDKISKKEKKEIFDFCEGYID